MNYLKGMAWIIIFSFYLFTIGTAIFPQKKAPYRFIAGYIVYLSASAIVGIPLQVFNGEWKIFYYYEIIFLSISFLLSIIWIFKRKIDLFEKGMITHYWFIFLPAAAMIFISLFYNHYYWFNEATDGGFYLTRIATLPYIKNPFITNSSVGNIAYPRLLDVYNYSVFELNASFFVYLLDMIPTLFARGFLSLFNYFLFSCSIYCLADYINSQLKKPFEDYYLQYASVSLLIFGFCARQVLDILGIYFYSGWAMNVAMYYGSMVVRSCGMIWLIIPLLEEKSFSIRSLSVYLITAFALFSLSPTSLPYSISIFLCGIFINLLKEKRYLLFVYIIILALIGLLIGNNTHVDKDVHYIISLNIKTILPFLMALGIAYLFYHYQELQNILFYSIGICLFCILPPFNYIIKRVSVYGFVMARFISSYYMFSILISLIGCLFIFYHLIMKLRFHKVMISCLSVLLMIAVSMTAISLKVDYSQTTVLDELRLFLRHRYFAADSVKKLGQRVNQLDTKKDQNFVVLAPVYVRSFIEKVNETENTASIAVANSIRQFAPYCISLNGLARYPANSDPRFDKYNKKCISIYNDFIYHPSEKTYQKFVKEILNKFPVSVVVSTDENISKYMKRSHYKLSYIEGDRDTVYFCIYVKD